ncbi:MAG: hypothetical protein ACON5H_08370 [Akkermansiaceae bacterium]
MTVMPILNGGLMLIPESDKDWHVLGCLAADADCDLAMRLGSLMDEESMWDDIVIPDLESHFSAQLTTVLKAIKAAQPKDQAEAEIEITKDTAEDWYGALNQARLGLEKTYHFGQEGELDSSDLTNPESRNAYLRSRFYSSLQGLLLEYVMTE